MSMATATAPSVAPSMPIDLAAYLPLKDCPKHLPRRAGGNRVSLATMYRWVLSGKLPAVRIGRAYFVHPDDLAAMARPCEPRAGMPSRTDRERRLNARERHTQEVLKRHGVIK